jgi:hypothetical protein
VRYIAYGVKRFGLALALVFGGIGCGDPTANCSTDTAWNALYTDYFGPKSKGTCSGAPGDENNCHLSASSSGAIAGNGFVCGTTKDTCYASFKAVLVPPMAGKEHYFEAALRQDPPTGCLCSPMPLRPAASSFTTCDIDRMRAWANKGAPND